MPGLAFLCPVIVTFLSCFFLVFGTLILSGQPFFFFPALVPVLSWMHFSPALLYPSCTMAILLWTISFSLTHTHTPHVAGRWRDGENDRGKDYRTSTRSQINSLDSHLFCILALCLAGRKEAARMVGMVTLCQPQSVITSEVTKACCGRRCPREGFRCLPPSGPDLCSACRMPDTPQLPAYPVTPSLLRLLPVSSL